MTDKQKINLGIIGDRLRKLRGRLSIDAFSDLLGIHKNTYRNYEKGVRPIGIDVITYLAEIGVNPTWIVKGEEDVMISDHLRVPMTDENELFREFDDNLRSLSKIDQKNTSSQKIIGKSMIYEERDQEIEERDHRSLSHNRKGSGIADHSTGSGRTMDAFAHIPLYDVKASAGNGAAVNTEDAIDSLAFKNEWIHNELHVNPAHLYLIYVEGESMVPSLRPGDVILVDHSDNTAKRDGIYVLRMDGALLVKRLQRLPGGIIKVGSDNPLYDPFEINLSKIGDTVSVIGRVVWTGRRL